MPGGHVCLGCVHALGACMPGSVCALGNMCAQGARGCLGGVHDRGCVPGGMHGWWVPRREHMHAQRGVCLAEGMHAQACMPPPPTPHGQNDRYL